MATATHGPQRIYNSAVTGTSTVVADSTDSKTSISVPKGGRVVFQATGFTGGSVYLQADAGVGTFASTGRALTSGDSGTGIVDLIANYDLEVRAKTSSDFAGTAAVLLKTIG